MQVESCHNCGVVVDTDKLDFNFLQPEQVYKGGVEGLFKVAYCPVCSHPFVGEPAE